MYVALGQADLPPPPAYQAGWPIGPTVAVFAVLLGGLALSFFVKRTPTGRWTWKR